MESLMVWGGCTEFHIDGVCLELGFGEFLEMNAKDYVPLHPPPLQGSCQGSSNATEEQSLRDRREGARNPKFIEKLGA